jgi:hypothetical protein
MGKKPKAGSDLGKDRSEGAEKTQAERFIETARQIGVDETGVEFERTLTKIVPTKPHQKKRV